MTLRHLEQDLGSHRLRRAIAGAAVGCLLAASLVVAQPTGTIRVANGLSQPTYVVAPPDDFARLFILELSTGQILIMDLVTGTVSPTPFLTVGGVSVEGLQGLAFHPQYDLNGYFYVYYFSSGTPRTVVERYTRDAANPDLADAASGQVVIEIAQPAGNHNGGWIGFGPDGYLYLPLGDGGGSCDLNGEGQDTSTHLGSLLRLDVDGDDFPADPLRNYAVPPSNPFVGQAGADEIWSYGLRNPFRSSFDRATGDLYMGDVGQETREEIDYQPASSIGGENWGWNVREGFIATPTAAGCVGGPPPPGNADPIYDYGHGSGTNEGRSVTGGYVYRGPGAAAGGVYYFADYVDERIWSINAVSGSGFTDWTSAFVPDVGTIDQIVSFGEDGAGYLYIVDLGGQVFRLVGSFPFVPCPDLVLRDDAVMGTEIFERCRNIVLGPSFVVGDGGDLTVRAGNRVRLDNGFEIAIGGELTAELDPSLQLVAP